MTATGSGSGTTVLVVDDEPDIRVLLRVVLERQGYTVVEAGDGLDALAQFALHRPDAMIVDLAMPNLGGVQVIKRLRSGSSIPMVGYSAAPSREDERALIALGVPLVTKDSGIDALLRVLETITNAA